uniref:Uncharacterized protein LOC113792029 n=1 Tax=Dermatophagoides pteronyssinus TaxID=6956 RepID=A0A6P6XXP9_DERPT|nr:uncharacterized protein LOC113792029 [Dermatophagoides pteronyssinus]
MTDEILETAIHPNQEEIIAAEQNDENQHQKQSQQKSELDGCQDDESTIKTNSSSEDDENDDDLQTYPKIEVCLLKNNPCDKKRNLSQQKHPFSRSPICRSNSSNQLASFTSDKNENSTKSSLKYWISAIFLVILASAVLSFPIEFRKVSLLFNEFGKPNSLNHDQIELIQKFLNETNSFMPDISQGILQTVIYNVYSSSASSIILLLIGNAEQQVQLHDISQNLANLIVELKQEDYFPTIQLDQHYTSDMIEHQFETVFNEEQRSVMVLEHLESLPSTVTTTFHQFVDNNQSKIPKSFTIITLVQNYTTLKSIEVDKDMSLLDLEKISTEILQQLWSKEVPKESLDCLINRLAEYSIILLS